MGILKHAVVGLLVILAQGCGAESQYNPRNGDIIFHISRSAQSLAVQMATKSQYSHMGIVYLREGKPFVFEAVESVKATPLEEWVSRGENGHFVVKRLSNASAVLTADAMRRMLEVGETFQGKSYDLYFEWNDDRVYCSELVWKVYQRALGIEVGALAAMGDFDLSSPAVLKKLEERWGGQPPMNETVIAPATIFTSNKLVEVYRN